jgi:ABC-2 type transport system permease protein
VLNEGEMDTTDEEIKDFIQFKETETANSIGIHELNSVQHNVPAWTLFGMFFIVISLAGSMIKERTDGSYLRIRTMPGSYLTVMAGKMIAYLLVCLTQCVLMIFTGIYLLPLFGLPQLVIGNNIPAIGLVATCCGLAATGYGILVGTIFNTHQQSSTFGSVSVVILAALGGIWVPVYVMPEIIRLLATYSPLFWGLQAFQSLFLSTGNTADIWFPSLKLLLFFFITLSIAYFINKYKNN